MTARVAGCIVVLSLLAMHAIYAQSESDVDWIKSLPGVSEVSQQNTPSEVSNKYNVAEPATIAGELQTQLSSRGWTVTRADTQPSFETVTHTIDATKSDLLLHIVIVYKSTRTTSRLPHEAGNMALTLTSKGTRPPVPPASGTVINGNDLFTSTVVHGPLTINGSQIRLATTGTCTTVVINGNSNLVTLHNAPQAITFNGNNNNVTYPTSGSAPTVKNNGTGNLLNGK